LKTAVIKQVHDVFGPWAGVRWKDTSPQKLFELWPFKAVYWELTCILQADWYIIPPTIKGDYIRDVTRDPSRTRIIEKYTTNVRPLHEVPLSDYDLVITLDPILQPPPELTNTLFAYYVQEHWDRFYKESRQKPYTGYDLFFDHMMEAPAELHGLSQSIAFPYLYDAQLSRSGFCGPCGEVAWVDFRTLMTLAGRTPGDLEFAEVAARERLEKTLDIGIRCSTIKKTDAWSVYDPPWWGDPVRYLRELSGCKYYIAVGSLAGAGQGLVEAAALGCLCIGQNDRAYHRLVCHPFCLCEDIAEMPKRFADLRGRPDLWEEIRKFQYERMLEHFLRGPLEVLERAVMMKRRK
jgi:hypothetical protein